MIFFKGKAMGVVHARMHPLAAASVGSVAANSRDPKKSRSAGDQKKKGEAGRAGEARRAGDPARTTDAATLVCDFGW